MQSSVETVGSDSSEDEKAMLNQILHYYNHFKLALGRSWGKMAYRAK